MFYRKTETVKDLAKYLANPCMVTNCGEGLDYKAMGSIFSGLAQSGAWGWYQIYNVFVPYFYISYLYCPIFLVLITVSMNLIVLTLKCSQWSQLNFEQFNPE